MQSKKVALYLVLGWLLFVVGCGRSPEIIPTPQPSPMPTATTEPTETPEPTAVPEPTSTLSAAATQTTAPAANLPSVREILAQNGRFSTFQTAFEEANLDKALGDPGPFTLFVPSNDAFAQLPPGLFDAFRVDPKGDLSELVLRHVVEDNLSVAALGELTAVTTAYGDRITLQQGEDGSLLLNGSVAITGEPLPAWNGTIYVIDAVLLPDIADLLLMMPQFTLLAEALETAGMMPQLREAGPFTLFAPTDVALAALPQELRQQLLLPDNGVNVGLLQNHLVGQQLVQPALAEGQTVATLGDTDIVITLASGLLRLNDAAQLTGLVLPAANGTIFGVDALLTLPTTLADS